MAFDLLLLDCRLATMVEGGEAYGAIENAALLIAGGRIVFAGAEAGLPAEARKQARVTEKLDGRWVTPGLIDCHTHLVFGGGRVNEFEARLGGASYEEIARAGGGILSTVTATRAASEDTLIAQAAKRLARMLRDGLIGIEIKSGYGLDRETEIRMLSAARALGEQTGVRVHTTYLGLHAVPKDFSGGREAYVKFAVEEMLPEMAKRGLADSVDAFLENIAFTADEVESYFAAAARLGVARRLHADQLSDGNGAALAAKHSALSADHLEYTNESGVAALAKSGSVAALLPGAFTFLNESRLPPIEAMRKYGVKIAIATDCNPGSSPLVSPLQAMSLACARFRLTPEEALAGMTRNAARALGWSDGGTLEPGKRADLAVWNIERPADLAYWMGALPCMRGYCGSAVLFDAEKS